MILQIGFNRIPLRNNSYSHDPQTNAKREPLRASLPFRNTRAHCATSDARFGTHLVRGGKISAGWQLVVLESLQHTTRLKLLLIPTSSVSQFFVIKPEKLCMNFTIKQYAVTARQCAAQCNVRPVRQCTSSIAPCALTRAPRGTKTHKLCKYIS